VPGTDRYRKPRLFVMTLRYPRRCFRRVVWKSSQETWARLHEEAWRYFGGSCRCVVLDNLTVTFRASSESRLSPLTFLASTSSTLKGGLAMTKSHLPTSS